MFLSQHMQKTVRKPEPITLKLPHHFRRSNNNEQGHFLSILPKFTTFSISEKMYQRGALDYLLHSITGATNVVIGVTLKKCPCTLLLGVQFLANREADDPPNGCPKTRQLQINCTVNVEKYRQTRTSGFELHLAISNPVADR